MASIALFEKGILYHPRGANLFGTTSLHSPFGTIVNARIYPGSTDSSGSVQGSLTAASGQFDTFNLVIRFSTPYSVAPKAVVLTPATPATGALAGVPVEGLLLSIDNITATGFEVIGYSPNAFPDGILFYYLVL